MDTPSNGSTKPRKVKRGRRSEDSALFRKCGAEREASFKCKETKADPDVECVREFYAYRICRAEMIQADKLARTGGKKATSLPTFIHERIYGKE